MKQCRIQKNAFNCANAPGKVGNGGCPTWWETVWENAESATKLVKGCGFEQLPMYLIEVVKAKNRPAATVEATRHEIAAGLATIAKTAAAVLSLVNGAAGRHHQNLMSGHEPLVLQSRWDAGCGGSK